MGLYNSQDAEPLTTWLVKNLDAISDAEPGALAKYILELLSMWNNDPEKEVRPRLVEELTDFLQKEAVPFVDRLLAALRSKSYLPYTTASDPPPNQNFNRDRQSRGRKRGLEQDDQELIRERDLRGPPKGPRIQNDRTMRRPPEGPRSRSQRPHDRDDRRSRERPPHIDGHDSRPDHGPHPPIGPAAGQRERCRDYYESGFCNRGATCPYSHGEDAMMAANPMGFPPMIPPAMAIQMFNGLFPPGYPVPFMGPGMGPQVPYDPTQQMLQSSAYGNGIQDLTPRGPRADRHPQVMPPNPIIPQMPGEDTAMVDAPRNEGPMAPQMDVHHERQPSRGRGGFGGRGRGGRPEHTRRTNVVDPTSLTIVVEKLPPEKTNISELTSWFSKFGTVTNVGVDTRGNRALVSFSTHEEAHKAWKSEEAVFGNRFVVIFWHRPAPGGGAAGQRALEASAQTVQKINSNGNDDVDMTEGTPAKGAHLTNGHQSSDAMDTTMNVVPTKKAEPKTPQEIYEYATRVWLEKMKGIMNVMQSTTASESEKQEAKAKFKVLKSQKPQPPSAAPAPVATNPATNGKPNLDLDLDMLASGQGQNLTQEEAQQALARLQELAAERGLDPNNMEDDSSQPHPYPGYRGVPTRRGWRGGYRGRGRGRGAAFAMASASLDNRTKKILLVGYDKTGVSDDAALDIVQSFYLPTGQAEEVHKGSDGGIAVAFPNRQAAEIAIRAGAPTIEGLPPLTMQWYNPPSTQQSNGAFIDTTLAHDKEESFADRVSAAKRPARGEEADEDHGWDEEDGGRRPR